MALGTENAFQQFEMLLRENLGSSVLDLHMDDLDDPALRMIDTMEPLGKGGANDSTTTYNYQARRKLKLSRGAMVKGGTFVGNTHDVVGQNNDLPAGSSTLAVGLDPQIVPMTQYITIATDLKRILGNVVVNMQQILADLIGDEIEEVSMGHIEDAVFQVRKQTLVWFYGDGSGQIATVDGDPASTAQGSLVDITVADGPYNRFVKGQRYELYQSSGWPSTKTIVTNGDNMICVDIDDVNRLVTFENANAGAVNPSDNDIIILKDTVNASANTSLVFGGIEYMFAATGEFYGLSAREDYSELVSYIEGSEASTVEPEPDKIALLINRIKKAGKAPPTTLVSESALSTQYAYLEKAGFANYPVPQRLASPDGGVGMPVFTHGTLVLPWETSEFIRQGMLWGAAPDTIMKYQPGGGNTIRWWNGNGPGNGIGSIFVPVNDIAGSTAAQTELWQAPFETHLEFLAFDPKRNFRRIGFITQETA